MASIRDTISSQIPGHILESYPRFTEFLEAYYEWLHQEGNPYAAIKYHMDYLDFQKSMDAYVDFMKTEYLHDIPNSVLVDKELFIKWSRKFHQARGSHASYKFLFKILFDEQDTSIYLPKENILKVSDGVWTDNESRMLLTNTAGLNNFSFQILEQEREIGAGVFEYAYATIQTAKRRYSGRYDLIELRVTDIQGTFYKDWPVKTEIGEEAWLIDTIETVNIVDGGENHVRGERITFDSIGDYIVERDATVTGEFDTHVTTNFKASELSVEVNSSPITDFTYDGRTIESASIAVDDTVTVTLPSFSGYMSVGQTDVDGSIIEVDILEAPIGTHLPSYSVSNDGYGTGFVGEAIRGLYSNVNGYYKNSRGHVSSNMYIQDSFFYQNYSYAIQTEQNIESYSEIVKDILHPSGFLMFGIMNIISVVESIIEFVSDSGEVLPNESYYINKYSLGPNYSFFDRLKAGLSKRLYRMYHFRDKVNDAYMDDGFMVDEDSYVVGVYPIRVRYDSDQTVGDEFQYVEDGVFENIEDVVETTYYKLEDKSLERTYTFGGYFDDYYYEGEFFQNTGTYFVTKDGWMTKHNLVDYHLFIPQDYSSEVESGNLYFETGYVSERAA